LQAIKILTKLNYFKAKAHLLNYVSTKPRMIY